MLSDEMLKFMDQHPVSQLRWAHVSVQQPPVSWTPSWTVEMGTFSVGQHCILIRISDDSSIN